MIDLEAMAFVRGTMRRYRGRVRRSKGNAMHELARGQLDDVRPQEL